MASNISYVLSIIYLFDKFGTSINNLLMIPSMYLPVTRKTHTSFSKQDDEKLRELVRLYGDKDWNLISQKFETKSPRQCRERYLSYLEPNITNGPWTVEEDQKLIEKVKLLGCKWVHLTQYFPGRSDNNLKNRWHTYLKKQVQVLPNYSVSKPQKTKPQKTKPIYLTSAIYKTPIQSFDTNPQNYENVYLTIPELNYKEDPFFDIPYQLDFESLFTN